MAHGESLRLSGVTIKALAEVEKIGLVSSGHELDVEYVDLSEQDTMLPLASRFDVKVTGGSGGGVNAVTAMA